LGEVLGPLNLKTGRLLPATPRLAANYRESGLVQRRNLAVAARANDGPFTISFADLAHRWTTEPRGRTTTPLPGDAFGIGGFSRAPIPHPSDCSDNRKHPASTAVGSD
jgi:hypothetical protein